MRPPSRVRDGAPAISRFRASRWMCPNLDASIFSPSHMASPRRLSLLWRATLQEQWLRRAPVDARQLRGVR